MSIWRSFATRQRDLLVRGGLHHRTLGSWDPPEFPRRPGRLARSPPPPPSPLFLAQHRPRPGAGASTTGDGARLDEGALHDTVAYLLRCGVRRIRSTVTGCTPHLLASATRCPRRLGVLAALRWDYKRRMDQF